VYGEGESHREPGRADAGYHVTVIIGNPPNNAGQKSEHDGNKNRSHKVVVRGLPDYR
jgi:predicted helicase